MISWIQEKFQKHMKIIFSLLLAIVIVSFVFTIGNMPGIGDARGARKDMNYYGYNLKSEEQMEPIRKSVAISQLVKTGRLPYSDQEFTQTLLARVALIKLADTLQIPEPSDEQFKSYVQEQPIFRDKDGQFNPSLYNQMTTNVIQTLGFTKEAVAQTLREDFRLEQAQQTLTGPGYVLPFEAETEVAIENTEWSIAMATIDFETFKPSIPTREEALREYFENHQKEYTIPEQVTVSMAIFHPERFAGKVDAPTEGELKQFFEKDKRNYQEGKGEVSFDSVRRRVTHDLNKQRANRLAEKQAYDFQMALFDKEIKKNSEDFNELLGEYRLELTRLPAISKENTPEEAQNIPAPAIREAFGLDSKHYYTDPFRLEGNATAMLFLEEMTPQRLPSFEEVKAEVARDYKNSEKRRLFHEKGVELYAKLKAGLQNGDAFDNLARNLGLNTQSFAPFTIDSLPENLNPMLLQQTEGMKAGHVSRMTRMGDKGYFLFLKNKEIRPIGSTEEAVQKTMTALKEREQWILRSSILQSLIEKGLEGKDWAERNS